MEKTYTVDGMTCGHCVQSVSTEVAKLPGVDAVDGERTTGCMTVTGDGFADEEVDAAVDEAGYKIATA